MREISIGENGQKITVSPLSRRQVRELKVRGYDFAKLDPEKAEEAMDLVFKEVLRPDEIELLEEEPYYMSIKVWKGILAETYGSQEEEKNS